jgi:NAD(P)-dependent dehydrogenase (short-subunit alcohol dehydrogenase family)
MGRVLVLGAQGAVGSAAAGAFERAGWDVLAAGRRPDAALHVDLDEPETLMSAMQGVDLAVNAVPHPRLAAERTVLEHGGLLINVADRSPEERRRLRELARPKGRVLLNWGVIPGLTALVAAELIEQQPEADEVEIAVTFSAAATSGTAGGEFLHRELGRRRRHATREIDFPAPLGRRSCIGIAEDQDGWLGSAAGERTVNTFMLLSEPGATPLVLLLNRLGLMRALPAPLFRVGRKRAAKRITNEPFCVAVATYRSGHRLAAAAIEGAGMYRSTAEAAVAAAEQLLGPGALPLGCLDPHEALSLASLRPALSGRGIAIGV